jgi:hypothetical protein
VGGGHDHRAARIGAFDHAVANERCENNAAIVATGRNSEVPFPQKSINLFKHAFSI